jgi:hypothetical protein
MIVPFDMSELTALIKRISELVFDDKGTAAHVELVEHERLIILGALSALEGLMVAQQVLYANNKRLEAPSVEVAEKK